MHPSRHGSGHLARMLGGSLLLAGAVGCGQAPEESAAATQKPIAGGTVDTLHHDVFLLAWHEGQSGALCTATLIAPNLLLTARHCVSPNASGSDNVSCGDAGLGEPRPGESFFATNDPQPRQDSPIFRGREVRVPDAGVDTCGYDIAMLILTENVPADVSTPAIPRIDRDAAPGETYTAVGYGATGTGESSGSRMQLGGLNVACQPGSCGEGVESTEFLGDRGICSGDSGGPALDRDGKVLGVVSRGGPECSEPIYGSVAAWRDFIVETAEEAAALGGYDAPFWVTTGSSDPPSPEAGAGAPNEPTAGVESDACRGGGECGAGLVCYAATSGAVGSCTASCQSASDCRGGATCQSVGSVSVCVKPGDDDGPGSSCAFSASSERSSGAMWLAAAGMVLALTRRRAASRVS